METKGEIIKLLVREILIQTIHSDGRNAPEVKLLVKFVFSQVVNYTYKRVIHNLGDIRFMGSIDQSAKMKVGNTSGERVRWARIQKSWLIKTLAEKVGIAAAHLSQIEGKFIIGTAEMKTLCKLATQLEQPVWFLGCVENMPEGTFFDRLEKARCYHGHTKVEMAVDIGVNYVLSLIGKRKSLVKYLRKKLYCTVKF